MKTVFTSLLIGIIMIQGNFAGMYEVARRMKLTLKGGSMIIYDGDTPKVAQLMIENSNKNPAFQAPAVVNFLGTAYVNEFNGSGELVFGDTEADFNFIFVNEKLRKLIPKIPFNEEGSLSYGIEGFNTIRMAKADYIDVLSGNHITYTFLDYEIKLNVDKYQILRFEHGFELTGGKIKGIQQDYSGVDLQEFADSGSDMDLDSLNSLSESLIKQMVITKQQLGDYDDGGITFTKHMGDEDSGYGGDLDDDGGDDDDDDGGDDDDDDGGDDDDRKLAIKRRALKDIINTMGKFMKSYTTKKKRHQ